ncbi:Dihydrofolate reductase [Paraoerskovia marina]|uniref:Dihydrofolate reductase n=1 Tax=Paraoerskovia marina TaxID=545619 RepID=A0A1H1MNL0_9CELL|nr:dihydrofolate reductase family protein [Paraoerskovia marina]SDR88381.1 Dihydrofolate reductase [Paraoerskovia marina]
MRLTVHTFLTLDGVMQGPGGPEEDTSGGFTAGGWMTAFGGPDFGAVVDSWFTRTAALLLGRTTYQAFAGFWPQVTDPENTVAAAINAMPKHVVSTTLPEQDWTGTRVVRPADGGAVEQVRQILDAGGPDDELQVHGSHRLARTLHDAGLVDEYRLLTFPVVLGQGKRLFDTGSAPSGFQVVETAVVDDVATYHVLRPVPLDAPREFAVEDGREVTR